MMYVRILHFSVSKDYQLQWFFNFIRLKTLYFVNKQMYVFFIIFMIECDPELILAMV